MSRFSHFFLADTRSAWFWLFVRVYVGWEWLQAGWGKVQNPIWAGGEAGAALVGFVQNALTKTGGAHPDVQWWYAWFLTHVVLPHAVVWSNIVAYGELLVGVALILGFLTGVSAFFGAFMNLNYMLAGTVSVNPVLFILGLALMLARRVSGFIGLDRYLPQFSHKTSQPRNST